ncbi:MAG: hypothetical protein NVS3B26_29510 [Mycobacteriales bacterium]
MPSFRRETIQSRSLGVRAGARQPADVCAAEVQQRIRDHVLVQGGEADSLDLALRPALSTGVDKRLERQCSSMVLDGPGLPRRTSAAAEQPLHLEGALSAFGLAG